VRTECVEGADDAAFCAKGVVVEAALFVVVAVHHGGGGVTRSLFFVGIS
jgi:hypothetical protein